MNNSRNDEEMQALQGLPWLARLVYSDALRPYMDYKTGIVGVRRGVSYQSIAEAMYVEPIPGRHSVDVGSPTHRAIRTAIDNLIKNGLLLRQGDESRLIFFLPKASTDDSAQKSSVRGTSGERQASSVRDNSIHDNELDDSSVRGPLAPNPGSSVTPPVSVNRSQSQSQRINIYVDPPNFVPEFDDKLDVTDPVVQVFTHWQAVLNKHGRKLDAKRRAAIAARLKDGYSVSQLMAAATGCAQSAWHQGKNADGKIYDDIALICRDASHVDQFLAIMQQRMNRGDRCEGFLTEELVIRGECHGR